MGSIPISSSRMSSGGFPDTDGCSISSMGAISKESEIKGLPLACDSGYAWI
jgi:hypothetical protein